MELPLSIYKFSKNVLYSSMNGDFILYYCEKMKNHPQMRITNKDFC